MKNGFVFIVTSLLILVFMFNSKRIAKIIKKQFKGHENIFVNEEINSSLDNKPQPTNKPAAPVRKLSKRPKGETYYLNSYEMEDNPYYHSIGYALMVLKLIMLEQKDITAVK